MLMSTSAEDSQLFDPSSVSIVPATTANQGASALYTPPILRLPVELLGMIFAHCDKDDDFRDTRPEIRLVCKDFEPVVAHMLAQEWSGCLDLHVNKHNMDGLAQIRSIFASNLKAIRLSTQRLNSINVVKCSDTNICPGQVPYYIKDSAGQMGSPNTLPC